MSIPVYNQDGSIHGWIDPQAEPDMPEDDDGNTHPGWSWNPHAPRPGRTIFDNDLDEENPADDYEYESPAKPPTNQFRPWAQTGNPWWGAPTPENRERLRQLRRSDGGPIAPRGERTDSLSERKQMAASWLQRTFGTQTKQVRKKGRWLR